MVRARTAEQANPAEAAAESGGRAEAAAVPDTEAPLKLRGQLGLLSPG